MSTVAAAVWSILCFVGAVIAGTALLIAVVFVIILACMYGIYVGENLWGKRHE